MKIGEYNFLGNYKQKDRNGANYLYQKGDVVQYEGQTFIASRTISDGRTPLMEEKSGWVSLSRSQVFYKSINAPFFAKEGDEWFDSDNGVNYKRVKDKNGEHWIEL